MDSASKNMNRILAIACFVLPFSAAAEMSFLEEAQIGRYILIGKAIDSDVTYHGKVEISAEDGKLVVIREIDGRSVSGSAAIEPALNGDTRVLRIRFSENGRKYEETCLFGSDLDNYSRISCYLYEPDVPTDTPGLEALFFDRDPD